MNKYDLEWHDWYNEVQSQATEARGFDEDEELDQDKLLAMYDEGLTVEEALEIYHTW